MRELRSTVSTALAPLGTFLALGILLLPLYSYELSPDAISYLSISAEYAKGYWHEAINAYWGPLYSWCITPLLLLHFRGMLAAKIVALLAGALTLFGLYRLSLAFDISESCRRAFLWVSVAMVLAFAIQINSPDLLFTAVLLLYLSIIFGSGYPQSRYGGPLCGVLGSLAYFAKSYGFFFFAAHFLLFSVFLWVLPESRLKRPQIFKHFLTGSVVFLAVSSVWVLTLHAKYGSWMLGTTGEFNHRLTGPEAAGYPHLSHLIPPASEHAITAWEDPSPAWLPAWNVLSSRSNLKHQVKIVYRDAKSLFRFWTYTTPLFGFLLLGYLVLCPNAANRRQEWIGPILTIALFSAGYLLITVEDRYFWLTDLLLLWIAFLSLDLLFKRYAFAAPAKTVLASAVVLSFLVNPVLILHAHRFEGRDVYRWSEQIKESGIKWGRLASCSDWQDSAYVAYVLGMPYYGEPVPDPEAKEVALQLNPDYRPATVATDRDQIPGILSANRIDYFIVWPSCEPIWPAMTQGAKAGSIELVPLNSGNGNPQ
ncbi:MAG: glycosyltransferase family 39 protein [Acidobacteriaceae bacterium]|nr:glycosyltransferase family 39 protein [Acidobacteriaceae bacterium]